MRGCLINGSYQTLSREPTARQPLGSTTTHDTSCSAPTSYYAGIHRVSIAGLHPGMKIRTLTRVLDHFRAIERGSWPESQWVQTTSSGPHQGKTLLSIPCPNPTHYSPPPHSTSRAARSLPSPPTNYDIIFDAMLHDTPPNHNDHPPPSSFSLTS